MPAPVPYTRSYSFTNAQADSPATPLSGVNVDIELDNIAGASADLTARVNAGITVDINQDELALVAASIDEMVFVAENIEDVRAAADLAEVAVPLSAWVPYPSYAAFLAAEVPENAKVVWAIIGGRLVAWSRSPGGVIGPTADGGMWSPLGPVTPLHFGARGDWDGATGNDDTNAIDAALTWWAAQPGRHLHFPQGWYYYNGSIDIDLNEGKGNEITMGGRLWHADPGAVTGNPIAWTIHNGENLRLDLRLQGGGKLGNFGTRSPNDGGTTFLKVHRVRWVKQLDIESMDYAGRVLHTTAEAVDGAARARNMNINLTTGNRTTSPGNVRCGQPIFADSNACEQTGSWGKFTWRGEGTMYGPIFERLNDVRILDIEAGLFVSRGLEFRGCVVVIADNIYTGQSDNSNSPGVAFIPTAAGRKCGDVHIKSNRSLTAIGGLYASDFDLTLPGLRVDSITSTASTYGVRLANIHNVTINALGGFNLNELLRIEGTCGDISVHMDFINDIHNDVVNVLGTVDSLTLSGSIRGGAAGYSLVNLGVNDNTTKVELISLDLASTVAAQLVNIGYAGTNRIRMIGGSVSVGGSTTVFNSPRRPEYISGVRGYQSKGIGSAVILNGTSSITVPHLMEATPQIVVCNGLHFEASRAYVSSITPTDITIQVPTAVTADRAVRWMGDAELALGDGVA